MPLATASKPFGRPKKVPVDTDSICQICKDMVTQARDQLKSNETEEELKEVFEGSCKLIPIKPVQKECIKVADDFLPELVEALASQMNPDVSLDKAPSPQSLTDILYF